MIIFYFKTLRGLKMITSNFVILTLSALAVQSAVLNREDTLLKRVARSPCDDCGSPYGYHPRFPPPPLPPPRFHSQNWSGFARGADGAPRGVFSGAAAAADLGTHSGSEAFSVAAASGNAGSNTGASGYGRSGAGASDLESGSGGSRGGFGAGSAGNSQIQTNGFNGQNNYKASDYKESHHSYQSGGGKHFEGEGGGSEFSAQGGRGGFHGQGSGSQSGSELGSSAQSGSSVGSGFAYQQHGSSGNEQQQQQLGGSFNGNRHDSQSRNNAFSSRGQGYSDNGQPKQQASFNKEHYATGSSSNAQSGALSSHGGSYGRQAQKEAEFSGNQQQLQQQQVQYGDWHKDGPLGDSEQRGSSAGASGSANGFADGQTALNGALNLASQGLQTAEGCSTCGKSSYALSNAKSHSGSAIALSIGG